MTLLRYLSRVFFVRFVAVLLALAALVELLEILDAMRQLSGANFSIRNMLTFSALRLPLALEQLYLLAILIGTTLTFRMLARSNEMTILRGSGMSPYRLLACLAPLTVLLSLVYFGLVDRIAPASERVFTEWWHTVTAAPVDDTELAKSTIWLRRGNEIISIGATEDKSRTLHRLTRYMRDDSYRLTQEIRAASAHWDNAGWHLQDVEIVRIDAGKVEIDRQDRLDWMDGPTADNIEQIALPTQREQSGASRKILAGEQSGIASAAHYRTLLEKSACAPFLPFLMVLLAVPALTGGGRSTAGAGMTISILLGLLFLIVNGFLASMSEAGTLTPRMAIWSAPSIFVLFGLYLLLHYEE